MRVSMHKAHAILVFSEDKTNDEISYECNDNYPNVLQTHTDQCEQTTRWSNSSYFCRQ